MSKLVLIGIGLIFLGFILTFIGSLTSKDKSVNAAGGVFIGPFPLFGFGDKRLFYVMWGIAIILFILYFFFRNP